MKISRTFQEQLPHWKEENHVCSFIYRMVCTHENTTYGKNLPSACRHSLWLGLNKCLVILKIIDHYVQEDVRAYKNILASSV